MKSNTIRTVAEKLNRRVIDLKKRSQAKDWPEKSIVYYVSDTPNTWSPRNLEQGIGGAEARVIFLSRMWVQLGYTVTVFNKCGDQAGLHDGVQYRPWQEFNPHDRFDVLIMWHFAWRLKFPIRARQVWLDLGKGVLLPKESSYEKLKHYDKIFCKNAFHRSTLPEIPDEKIAVIPNGVESRFLSLRDHPKEPFKVIYASNYGRGLELMLKFGWPIIKEQVPEAELHICYGWPRGVDPTWKRQMAALMEQPGVIERGKLGRDELMLEKASSTINYYGCNFAEIDCNTVRESALVGCIPVTTDFAGLGDKDYCIKVSGNPHHSDTQVTLAHQVAHLLKSPHKVSKVQKDITCKVENETWEKVAQLWLDNLN